MLRLATVARIAALLSLSAVSVIACSSSDDGGAASEDSPKKKSTKNNSDDDDSSRASPIVQQQQPAQQQQGSCTASQAVRCEGNIAIGCPSGTETRVQCNSTSTCKAGNYTSVQSACVANNNTNPNPTNTVDQAVCGTLVNCCNRINTTGSVVGASVKVACVALTVFKGKAKVCLGGLLACEAYNSGILDSFGEDDAACKGLKGACCDWLTGSDKTACESTANRGSKDACEDFAADKCQGIGL